MAWVVTQGYYHIQLGLLLLCQPLQTHSSFTRHDSLTVGVCLLIHCRPGYPTWGTAVHIIVQCVVFPIIVLYCFSQPCLRHPSLMCYLGSLWCVLYCAKQANKQAPGPQTIFSTWRRFFVDSISNELFGELFAVFTISEHLYP